MNLGTTRLRGRPRNRWQDEVREDGRIVGGEGWQEKVHNREEWKKLLRTARNRHILHTPMEWMNERVATTAEIGFTTMMLNVFCRLPWKGTIWIHTAVRMVRWNLVCTDSELSWTSSDLSRMMHCWAQAPLQFLAHHSTPPHSTNAGDILYIHM